MTNQLTAQDTVEKLLERMEYKERTEGKGDYFASFKSEYIGEDFYYRQLSDVLHNLSAGEEFKYMTMYNFLVWFQEREYELPEDAEDEIFEFCDSEVPIYTHKLTEWLHGSNYHVYWLEDAVIGHCQTEGFKILSSAYYLACEEIAWSVLSVIRELYEDEV